MAIPKIPIYRYFANESATSYSYSMGIIPSGSVSPTVVGFSGHMSFTPTPSGSILEPTAFQSLTLWMDNEDASISSGELTWQPKVGTYWTTDGTVMNWSNVSNTGNSFETVDGNQFVNLNQPWQTYGIPESSSGNTQGRDLFFNTAEYHLFFVGVFTANPTSNEAYIGNDHRIFADWFGVWGLIGRNDSTHGHTLWAINWDYGDNSLDTVFVPFPTLNEPYLIEFWREASPSNLMYLRVNNNAPVSTSAGPLGFSLNTALTLWPNPLGYVAETAWFDEYHDKTEEQIVELRRYFGQKYGIEVE